MGRLLLGCILLAGCQLPGVTSPREPVEMSLEDFTEYYGQFERRANFYFCGERVPGRACERMPEIPPVEEEWSKFRWRETGARKIWGGTCTCSHGTISTVNVPADEWDGGCTPHEIGHGVLKRLGDPCWRTYEHSTCRVNPVSG